MSFPRPVEGGNSGDGSPLRLGDSAAAGDAFLANGNPHLVDWNGDGRLELVDSGGTVFVYGFEETLADGTPVLDRGQRWGEMSRSHQRDESDMGLCGRIEVAGDFDGDGYPEILLGPRPYSRMPPVMLSLAGGPPTHRSQGQPVAFSGGPDADGNGIDWATALAPCDWDGDGRLDLVAAVHENGDYWLPPGVDTAAEDQRDRYRLDGTWKGIIGPWSLHLLRNACSAGSWEFEYCGKLDVEVPGGPLCPVDGGDPSAGLLILDYYGPVWHLPLLQPGEVPEWGGAGRAAHPARRPVLAPRQLPLDHHRGSRRGPRRPVRQRYRQQRPQVPLSWPRHRGAPRVRRAAQAPAAEPHVNGGCFSVPTTGDWRATGRADLLVGSVEGYVFWYKTLSTDPLRFAPPERVRAAGDEIRYTARPNPAAGHHWGGSQGPLDGNIGGYSNPCSSTSTATACSTSSPAACSGSTTGTRTGARRASPSSTRRIACGLETSPFSRRGACSPDSATSVAAACRTSSPWISTSTSRSTGAPARGIFVACSRGEKLRFEDGDTIKTHGPYTPQGGDGRGRSKIQVVDWDGNGLLDLMLGVGPQPGSTFRGSFVLLCRNVGTNAEPLFARPQVLLFGADGKPQEFFRHGAHPSAVDWDGDGGWELLAGADFGHVWYWKPENFGSPSGPFEIYRPPGDTSL